MSLTGWLHLSEVDACVRHMSDASFSTSFEVDIVLDIMRLLVGRLRDAHVRLVFNIESP